MSTPRYCERGGPSHFAYVTGRDRNGPLQLCRLRYMGWGFAVYPAGKDGYWDSILPSGNRHPTNETDHSVGTV